MKVDFKKSMDSYKAKRGEFRVVEVPPLSYLMVDGLGDPNTSPEFADAVEALFGTSYKVKFASKKELGRDYVVGPLEGLWWSDDMSAFTTARDKSNWRWTMMVMQPDWITAAMIETARDVVRKKNPSEALARLRLEQLDERTCVQALHVGSFEDEGEILARMHDKFIPENGFALRGLHHEIYLSDFRRVEPAKLRTILRQPVAV